MQTFFSAGAIFFTAVQAFPQIMRILVHTDPRGVSASAWLLRLTNCIAWGFLAIADDMVPLLIMQITLGASSLGILALLVVKKQLGLWKLLAVPVTVAAGCTGIWFTSGVAGLTALSLIVSSVMVLPQLFRVIKHDSPGVSISTWLCSATGQAFWAGYAYLADKFSLKISTVIVGVPSLLIAYILYRRRRLRSEGASVPARRDDPVFTSH